MIEQLAKRLDELSKAVSDNRMLEFSMSIPADPKRDADIVLLDASTELVKMYDLLVAIKKDLLLRGDIDDDDVTIVVDLSSSLWNRLCDVVP